MPLFINEDRQELNKKQIVIPRTIQDHLQKTRAMYQGYEKNKGFKRLKKYTEGNPYNDRSKGKKTHGDGVKSISFSDAKRTLSDMVNTTDKNKLSYTLNGGQKMEQFLDNAIKNSRGVGKVKQVKPVPKLNKPAPNVKSPKSKEIKVSNGNVRLEARQFIKEELFGKKFGENCNNSRNVTQAEYNFYKRYGMGENTKPKKIYISENQINLLNGKHE